MLSYIARRLLHTVPVMLIVALLIFSLLYLAPGDPVVIIAGEHATARDIEIIRQEMGLDQPFFTRFANWVVQVASGDFGTSYYTKQPVSRMILERLEPTLSLMCLTLLISVTIAVPLGVLAAHRAGSLLDRVIMGFAVLGFSVPIFIVGYLLTWIFAVNLRWLPVQGYTSLSQGVGPWLSNLILPAIALGAVYIGLIARTTRAAMLETLQQDYIRTARAKGLKLSRLLFLHALKSASVPVVTIIGIGVALLISGAVVIESVYAIPGLGRLTVDAVMRRDYPVIQMVILLFSLTYVVLNVLIDIIYVIVDPRVKF